MNLLLAAVALGAWLYLMDRWAKSNAKPLIDLTPLEEWFGRNWTPIKEWLLGREWTPALMVSGAVIILSGLSGWEGGGGLSSSDRRTFIAGVILVGIGWLCRRT